MEGLDEMSRAMKGYLMQLWGSRWIQYSNVIGSCLSS